MPDNLKTKGELLEEVYRLRARISELEQAVSTRNKDEQKPFILEDQVKDIFENIAVGVYRTTPDGRILMANSTIVRLLGYSSFEELAQRNLENEGFEPGYPRSAFKTLIEKEGKVTQLESAWTKRDGSTIFVSESARAVRDETGRTIYYEGIVQDITEQKKAEENVRSLKQQMEFILGATKTGLDIIDSEFNIRYIDSAWQKIYGDPTGKKCYKYFMGRTEVCPGCGIPKALATKAVTVTEEVLVRENNRPIQVTTIPFQNEKGEWLVAEVNVDITERKKAEDAVRRHEEMLRAILNATTESVLLVDPQGIILTLNETAANRFGKDASQLIGQKGYDVLAEQISHDVLKSRLERIATVLSTGKPVHFEDQRGERTYYTSAYPVFDQTGKVVSIAIFGQDITERVQAQQALRKSEEMLRAVFDATTESILLVDKKITIVASNKMAAARLGIPLQELVGMSANKVVERVSSPSVIRSRIRNIRKVLCSGKPLRAEDYYRGMILDIHYYPVFDSNGEVSGVAAFARDITEQRSAEKALEEAKLRYQTLFDSVPIGISITTPQGQILEINQAMFQMTGYRESDIGRISIKDIYHSLNQRRELLDLLKKQSVVRDFKAQFKRKDGTFFDVNATVTTLTLAGQKVILGAMQDVTEHEKMQAALRESETKYRILFDSAPMGIGITTSNGRFLQCNRMMLQMTGYRESSIAKVNAIDLYHSPDQRQAVLGQLKEQGFVRDFKIKLKRKDGTLFDSSLTATPLTLVGKNVIMAIAQDITEREKMQAALRESEEKYRVLVEGAGECILIVNTRGEFLFMNKTAAEKFGMKVNEFAGKTLWDVFPRKNADRNFMTIREVIKTGRGANNIGQNELHGQLRWYNTSLEPLRDSTGMPFAAMIIARDIHDYMEAREELQEYRENMMRAERLASVGTLSATLAHELTQPLTVIRLSIQNSLAELKTASCTPVAIDDLDDGLAAVSTITSIIDRFRNFARKTPGKTLRPVNLKILAEKIVALLEHNTHQTRLTIYVKGFDKLPSIHAVENDIEQIFFALIENTIQAADGKKDRRLTITSEVKGGFIKLRFTDTCSGIKRQNLNKIFDPFFTTKPAGQSTGLGLCIVQRIVSHAGGEIRVESRWGKGTTFLITWPMRQTKL